jgi:gliding motility-associated-like protein
MKKLYVLLLICAISYGTEVMAQTIRYVKAGATGTGTSWADASGDLQAIINDSVEGIEIWVAAGTYIPNRRADDLENITINDRNNAFVLKAGVNIYGGFAGDETTKDGRNFIDNETILSGNIGDPDTNTDNSYHVVAVVGEMGEKTIFDGFTVEDGYTQGTPSLAENIAINGYNVPNTRSPGIIAYYVNFIELRNLIVRNNVNASADQNAGALYMFQASGNLRDVTFQNNRTSGGVGGAMYTYGIANIIANINFYNVKFIGNESGASAGALYMGQYSNLNFYNCLFEGNKAETEGGVFYLGSSSSTAVFNDCDFIDNQSKTRGGAFRNPNSGRLTINGGSFINNRSTVSNAGGAISSAASGLILNLNGVRFLNNRTTQSGGGAVYSGSGTYNITKCYFEGNVASSLGGAIYFEPGTTTNYTVTDCDFINNTAGTNGGAIYMVGAAASARIISSRLVNNNSGTSGGALTTQTNASFTVINSIIAGNVSAATSSTGGGGAGYLYSGTRMDFINCTIANNSVSTTRKAGGFYLAGTSQVHFYNTISFGNRGGSTVATNPEHEFFLSTGSSTTIKNSLTEYYGTTDATLGNVVSPTFSFASTTLGDANFLEIDNTNPESSKVIDKGNLVHVPIAIDLDAFGKGRIANGTIDIGAVEFMGAAKNDPTVVTIEENTAAGTFVVDPVKTILETSLAWSIIAGNESGAFAIDAATGAITVANSTPLNFEATRQFVLTALAAGATDSQKITVIVNIDNVAEAPERPDAENTFRGNIVTSYKPTFYGVAEANSTLAIYMDGVKLPYIVTVDENNQWRFKVPDDLPAGFHNFTVTSTVDGEESAQSPILRIQLKLYGGGTSGIVPTNILTPNNDGKNDFWNTGNLSEMYPEHQIVVYDKVGKVVFKWDSKVSGPYDSNNYNGNAWNGTLNGNPLPNGTYYYNINIGNGLDRIKGSITIIRSN